MRLSPSVSEPERIIQSKPEDAPANQTLYARDKEVVVSGPLPYQAYSRLGYDVEVIFQETGDVIYHFFPRKGRIEFPFGHQVFGMLVEDALVYCLGDLLREVGEADYMSADEARFYFIARADDPMRIAGQATIFVKLKGLGKRRAAQDILVDRPLGRLDLLIERANTESLASPPHSLYFKIRDRRWRD